MKRVMEERREDIAEAMRGLCDAVGRLSLVRDEMVEALSTVALGSAEEKIALAMQRTCERLTQAATQIPDECWNILLAENMVGGEEVRKRVESMIKNTMILDNYQACRLAVPA